MADTRQIVFDSLRSLGLSPQQALGAMYSIGGESGATFNTKAYNPNDPGGSVGIAQWMGPRRKAEEAMAAQMGRPADDPYVQANFLKQELQGKYAGVLDALKQASSPEQAAHIWTAQFERPKVDNSEQRIRGGHEVGSLDAQGNFVPGIPGTTITSKPPDGFASAAPPGPGAPAADGSQPQQTASASAPPVPPPAPPSALDAVLKAYGGQDQQQQPAPQQQTAMAPPTLTDNSGAIAAGSAPLLQQLIAQKRAEMGFNPIEMG